MRKKAKKVVLAFGLASGVGVINPALPTTGLVQQANAREHQVIRYDRNPGRNACGGLRPYSAFRRPIYSGCGVPRRPTPNIGCGGYTGRRVYTGCGVPRRPTPNIGCGGYTGRRVYTGCGVPRPSLRAIACGGFSGQPGVTARRVLRPRRAC